MAMHQAESHHRGGRGRNSRPQCSEIRALLCQAPEYVTGSPPMGPGLFPAPLPIPSPPSYLLWGRSVPACLDLYSRGYPFVLQPLLPHPSPFLHTLNRSASARATTSARCGGYIQSVVDCGGGCARATARLLRRNAPQPRGSSEGAQHHWRICPVREFRSIEHGGELRPRP